MLMMHNMPIIQKTVSPVVRFWASGILDASIVTDWTLVSASYQYTHDSSLVISVFRNSGSLLAYQHFLRDLKVELLLLQRKQLGHKPLLIPTS
jgi:hypothetical protein